MDTERHENGTQRGPREAEQKNGMNGKRHKPSARTRTARPLGKGRPAEGADNPERLQRPVGKGATGARTAHAVATQFDFRGCPLRTVTTDGEMWFVAADVCAILEHTNPTKAVERLEDDETGLTTVQAPHGGDIQMNVVSESGLYALVFTSRKPEARAFRRWVTGEVLPSIRRTGSYHVDPTEQEQARQGARHVELPGDGLYVVTASPGRPTHIRQVDYDAMLRELDSLDTRIMACALVTIAAYWQRVQQMNAIAFDPKRTHPLDRLERAIIEGVDLAHRHFKATEAAGDTPRK